MLDFSGFLNLPMIWGGLIFLALALYVLLDGFDLGVGILFPFAPSDDCRSKMMNSIAPFWDGNETWLVLGGGGLFAAFPQAFSIIMPAVYIPVCFMMLALVFRGVAFEFRFKTKKTNRKYWDHAFHFGSLIATFCQGIILGSILQGIKVSDGKFSGGPFDWLTGFSIVTGIALISGYSLLGSTWLIMKTCTNTQEWARKVAKYTIIYVLFFMFLVSIWMPYVDTEVFSRWFSMPNFLYLSVIPLTTLYVSFRLVISVMHNYEYEPFIMTIILFILGFVGILISTWPYLVPREVTFAMAAAGSKSQTLMLCGAVVTLPIILLYTAYNYYVFRGKSSPENMY